MHAAENILFETPRTRSIVAIWRFLVTNNTPDNLRKQREKLISRDRRLKNTVSLRSSVILATSSLLSSVYRMNVGEEARRLWTALLSRTPISRAGGEREREIELSS